MEFELLMLILLENETCSLQIEVLDRIWILCFETYLRWNLMSLSWSFEGGAKEKLIMKQPANTIRGKLIWAQCSGCLKYEAGHFDYFRITWQLSANMKLEFSSASTPQKENHVTYMLPKFSFEKWWAVTLLGWMCHFQLGCFSLDMGNTYVWQTPRNAARPSLKYTFAFWPPAPPSCRSTPWTPQIPSTWEHS